MANDYAQIQARIADEIQRTDLTSQIVYAISDAIKHYERRRFYFNTTIGTFSTVANQEYYTSTDFADIATLVTIEDMTVTITTAKYPMTPMDFDMMDGLQTGAIIADPLSYAYYRQQIRLYPIPSAVRTITMAYVDKFAALSAGTDTNAWMTDGEELIRARAKKNIATDVLYDSNLAQVMDAREQSALAELLAENRRRMSNGVLRTDVPLRRQRFNIVSGW